MAVGQHRWITPFRCCMRHVMSDANPVDDSAHLFKVLDALRGIAALIVVTRHTPNLEISRIFPGGYLSVDLFFMLSGFVIAHAYQERVQRGDLTANRFMLLRMIRLGPLHVLGMLIAAVVLTGSYALGGLNVAAPNLVVTILFGLFLFPLPLGIWTGGKDAPLFPANGPTWSLFFELLANFLYALTAARLTLRALSVIAALAAGGLVFAGWKFQSLDCGSSWETFGLGMVRVAFGFTAGLILRRLWSPSCFASVPPWTSAVLLLGALMVPLTVGRGYLDAAIVLVGCPLLIWFGACSRVGATGAAVCNWLGACSYGVYVLHSPLIMLVGALGKRLVRAGPLPTGVVTALGGPIGTVAFAASVFVIAVIADRAFDRPARSWLKRTIMIEAERNP